MEIQLQDQESSNIIFLKAEAKTKPKQHSRKQANRKYVKKKHAGKKQDLTKLRL